ncbi:hypothetical protein BU14_0165s0021 [Porphyra umbilicalis]|uniref:Sodium/calcium exchanger membrane region domain-containing protein n=1 Tax=Porphyra umbilicalis TaxID=2786 RepID=A0A1X6P874_PORUM|nr:hypothetical protein BU14_0165s0021 [Porphyra umbilicalis]|eukprot:OSX77027.1 hypothetical protein BU14_0165s0021 [Porphyra umbilicalis]
MLRAVEGIPPPPPPPPAAAGPCGGRRGGGGGGATAAGAWSLARFVRGGRPATGGRGSTAPLRASVDGWGAPFAEAAVGGGGGGGGGSAPPDAADGVDAAARGEGRSEAARCTAVAAGPPTASSGNTADPPPPPPPSTGGDEVPSVGAPPLPTARFFLGVPLPHTPASTALFPLIFPWLLLFRWTTVDCGAPARAHWWPATLTAALAYMGTLCYALVQLCRTVGCVTSVPSVWVGLVPLAVATSLPDLPASVVVTLQGHGDMAVSNVVGSQRVCARRRGAAAAARRRRRAWAARARVGVANVRNGGAVWVRRRDGRPRAAAVGVLVAAAAGDCSRAAAGVRGVCGGNARDGVDRGLSGGGGGGGVGGGAREGVEPARSPRGCRSPSRRWLPAATRRPLSLRPATPAAARPWSPRRGATAARRPPGTCRSAAPQGGVGRP